jgi:D-alanine-D-alanine ligase
MTASSNGHVGKRVRAMVLFGGRSGEHDVSLRSAQTVMAALDPERYEIVPVGITRDGLWLSGGDPMLALTADSPLFALPAGVPGANGMMSTTTQESSGIPDGISGHVDVVIPVLHGPMGEDGTVQGMFELMDVPYVGSGVLGSAVAMDKGVAKNLLARAGVPQGPWLTILRRDWERDPERVTDQIGEALGYPCFVKPANMGSSVGVGKAHDPSELPECMGAAGRYDRRIVVEKGLNARELEIAVLGNDDPIASIAGEIVPKREFYDYVAKYVSDDSELIIPAQIDESTLAEMQRIAIAAFRSLDLAGMARVDFFLERETGELFVNEVNTIPGFTSISMYPMLWAASGVPIAELLDRLVVYAMERHAERRG